MQNQSFLILIDDLVKPIPFLHDLLNPPQKDKNYFGRIVFTTRLRNLPQDISCPLLHIAPLSPKQSWRLVHDELVDSDMVSDPAAMKLAEEMIDECHGLPLALKVVAGAIKGIGRRPLEELRSVANELSSPIKLYRFAMDCLPSSAVRECFLYAAMFPKDHWILEEELIQLWIGDELLPINARGCHVADQVQLGQDFLEILKSANLLVGRLSEMKWEGKVVQMHNTLRHIALCDNREFFVQSGAGLAIAPAAKKWALAKRISLMYNEIKELTETPRCNWLETMLLRYNRDHLAAFPQNFFQFSPRLRVLDLSFSHVRELPRSIGKLAELQYLNLSHTELESLPEEMRRLKKLKWLSLRRTCGLDVVPRRLLSSLVALQSLNTFTSAFKLDKNNSSSMIQDMENMKDLEVLGITTNDVRSLQKISNRSILATKMECVEFSSCPEAVDIELSPIFGSMEGLKQLLLHSLFHLKNITMGYDSSRRVQCFRNLERLEIIYCPLLTNISWAQCLPNL